MTQVERLLALRAAEAPGETAYLLGADGRALTWGDVAEQADRLRAVADDRGLGRHARIGISSTGPLEFASAYLGILGAGRTAVPIDPRLTPGELSETAERLHIDALITDGVESCDHLVDTELWDAHTLKPITTVNGARPSDGTTRHPAVLLSSSGTTGRPKGIGLSAWQLLHAARRVARHHEFGPGERGYSPLPLFHVNAQVMGLLATLVSGASLMLDARFDRDAYWDRVATHRPTWLNAVPAILATLATMPAPSEEVAAGIRFARSASAPLPVETERAFAAATGIQILQTYGMTEAAGQITSNPLDPKDRKEGSVGVPVGIGLSVLGPDGVPVSPGELGMVALRGRQIADEYLFTDDGVERGRPARDAAGWLLTGDLGHRDADGFVYLAGRADDVINRGGEKVFPLEVENVLLAHPAVRSAAVVAAPHQRLGEVPVALITADPVDQDQLIATLHDLCQQRLARWKQPSRISVAATLPTGPTGKVLRRAVREELAR